MPELLPEPTPPAGLYVALLRILATADATASALGMAAHPVGAPYGQEGTYNFREYDGRTNGSAHSLSVSYSDSWAAETSTHDFAGSLVTGLTRQQ